MNAGFNFRPSSDGGNKKLPAFANPHAGHAFIDARDYLTGAEHELTGWSFLRLVKITPAVGQRERLVDQDGLSGLGRRTGAFRHDFIDEP